MLRELKILEKIQRAYFKTLTEIGRGVSENRREEWKGERGKGGRPSPKPKKLQTITSFDLDESAWVEQSRLEVTE